MKSNPRSDDYTFTGGKNTKTNLTYRISKYSRKLKPQDVDDEIARAFNIWGKRINSTFIKTTNNNPDFEIRFEEGYYPGRIHGFDQTGDILAYSTRHVDGLATQIYFNDSVDWTIGDKEEKLFQVAASEIGQALGLVQSPAYFP